MNRTCVAAEVTRLILIGDRVRASHLGGHGSWSQGAVAKPWRLSVRRRLRGVTVAAFLCFLARGVAAGDVGRNLSAAESEHREQSPPAGVAGQSKNPFLEPTLLLPAPGDSQLRILSPTLLELIWINTKQPDPARVESWDFVGPNQDPRLPAPAAFVVRAGLRQIPVNAIGFKRRVLYAPLKKRDLRIGNYLYLQLATSIADGQIVEVKNPAANLWPTDRHFIAHLDGRRWSPAIHVNQAGYLPAFPKKAMVGYYLGSLGEMNLARTHSFQLLEAGTAKEILAGRLSARPDVGFTFASYGSVLEADFSDCDRAGEYRLSVPGLGRSFPFRIDEGIAAAFARTAALGLYHQRCGTANALPYTRHAHAPCHTAPAEIPTKEFAATQKFIAESSADYARQARHTAPPLSGVEASLYPFVNRGKVDVSGGHHDAGDYSKYTLNSAAFIHYLVFAVDVFAGVGELDNLGIPESGDGQSDLLQEAKWEADFLAKMQDADGGFYFLVYPRDRRYEQNVLPDHGDPQVVWPKNTSATAAAVAALAQCASSPLFKKQFPAAANLYLEKAKMGWAFLERAIAQCGPDGAYQKLTHYGDDFMHDDELAWAACEMFLATADEGLHKKLTAGFSPSDPNTRKWGWWRMYEGYGCAARSYALAAKSGRINAARLDPIFLARCEDEVIACAEDQLRWAQNNAYGTSFPEATKRVRSAGWYFSTDGAFDLAAACALDYPPLNDPRPKFLEAILSNLNYEAGCNPVNICFLTGLGWKRPREIVHQYAQNDARALPPSGIPVGNIQGGFGWLEFYKQELGALSYPADGAPETPYPLYDRWGDSFNVQTEFVIVNQARSLAGTAYLMAKTTLKKQAWQSAPARITGLPRQAPAGRTVTARIEAPGLDLRQAGIIWEARGQEPASGAEFSFTPSGAGPQWVEVEAHWPDGRRVFAAANFTVNSE